MTETSKPRRDAPAEPPVRDSGPGEGVWGNREVPPATLGEAESEQVSIEERLAQADARAEEHLNDLKRLAAEFDNYRKRAARDQESLVARAAERLVKELLPVLDDLERTALAAREHKTRSVEDGVRLVHRSLAAALRKEGLEEIPTDGAFDPHVHEALLSQPSEAEEGTVIEVLQKGYRLGDRVLRPARVVVAGAQTEGE